MAERESKATLERRLADERAARAGAAAAEAEPVDGDEVDPDEPPAEEPEVERLDDVDEPEAKSDEQRVAELDALMVGFEAGLRDLFGIAEPLEQVPMDGAIGYMLPGALVFKTHEKYRRCATCNGHGQVMTGSLADGQQTADCPRCGGRGYLERVADEQPAGEPEATNGNSEVDPDAGYGVPSWMGDPAIGKT